MDSLPSSSDYGQTFNVNSALSMLLQFVHLIKLSACYCSVLLLAFNVLFVPVIWLLVIHGNTSSCYHSSSIFPYACPPPFSSSSAEPPSRVLSPSGKGTRLNLCMRNTATTLRRTTASRVPMTTPATC